MILYFFHSTCDELEFLQTSIPFIHTSLIWQVAIACVDNTLQSVLQSCFDDGRADVEDSSCHNHPGVEGFR